MPELLRGIFFALLKQRSETEISPVILLNEMEIFKDHISYLFIWNIENFLFNESVADGFCLRGGIVHQVFLQGHQGVGVAAVLDLPALAQ